MQEIFLERDWNLLIIVITMIICASLASHQLGSFLEQFLHDNYDDYLTKAVTAGDSLMLKFMLKLH